MPGLSPLTRNLAVSFVNPIPAALSCVPLSNPIMGTPEIAANSMGWIGPQNRAIMTAFGRSTNFILARGTYIGGLQLGMLGTGTVIGKYVQPPLASGYIAALSAMGIVGVQAATLANACSIGLATGASALGVYKGTSPVATNGAGIGKVYLVNLPLLALKMQGEFACRGILGPAAPRLAAALSMGAAAQIMLGFGIEFSVGAPAFPVPSPSVTFSQVY